MEEWASDVLAVCPGRSRSNVLLDLRRTGSVEATINRILDGSFLEGTYLDPSYHLILSSDPPSPRPLSPPRRAVLGDDACALGSRPAFQYVLKTDASNGQDRGASDGVMDLTQLEDPEEADDVLGLCLDVLSEATSRPSREPVGSSRSRASASTLSPQNAYPASPDESMEGGFIREEDLMDTHLEYRSTPAHVHAGGKRRQTNMERDEQPELSKRVKREALRSSRSAPEVHVTRTTLPASRSLPLPHVICLDSDSDAVAGPPSPGPGPQITPNAADTSSWKRSSAGVSNVAVEPRKATSVTAGRRDCRRPPSAQAPHSSAVFATLVIGSDSEDDAIEVLDSALLNFRKSVLARTSAAAGSAATSDRGVDRFSVTPGLRRVQSAYEAGAGSGDRERRAGREIRRRTNPADIASDSSEASADSDSDFDDFRRRFGVVKERLVETSPVPSPPSPLLPTYHNHPTLRKTQSFPGIPGQPEMRRPQNTSKRKDTSAMGRENNAASMLEKEEKMRAKESKEALRRQKADEKAEKAREKQDAALQKKAHRTANIIRTKTDCVKEMTLRIPTGFGKTPENELLAASLREVGAKANIHEQDSPDRILLWDRTVTRKWEGDEWKLCPAHIEPAPYVLARFTGPMLNALLGTQDASDPVSPLIEHYDSVRASYPGRQVIYMLEGVEAYFRRKTRGKAGGGAPDDEADDDEDAEPAGTGRPSSAKTGIRKVAPITSANVENELVGLQLHATGSVRVHTAKNFKESVEWISSFTEQIALAPELEHRSEVAWALSFGDKIRSGEGAQDTYVKMLQQIQLCTLPRAAAIATVHPSLRALNNAFAAAPDPKALLAKIKVQYDSLLLDPWSTLDPKFILQFNLGTEANHNIRNMGPQLAKRVHAAFRETNPEFVLMD
ncbi:putative monocarboxylate transporter mch1 [Thoreauomyces humboldtii]|nr:putative monocarboxylate transporter mch1 [Thoreauomyces humboldtii]